MTIQQFIEKAVEGGWINPYGDDTLDRHEECQKAILLDPLAWKAVGKIERWDEEKGAFMYEWTTKMHFMIDALAEGKTISDFLATLT